MTTMAGNAGLFGTLCETCFKEIIDAIRPNYYDWAYCRHTGAFLQIETFPDQAFPRYTLSGPYRSYEEAMLSEGLEPASAEVLRLRRTAGEDR